MLPTGSKHLQAGYTLLELLVVVAILAIAVSVLSVGFSAPGRRSPLEKAARQLAADLDAVSTEAIATGDTHTVEFDEKTGRYHWGETTRSLPQGVAMEIVPADTSSASLIRFFPNGRNSGADVTLRDGETEARLNASWLTGAIARSP